MGIRFSLYSYNNNYSINILKNLNVHQKQFKNCGLYEKSTNITVKTNIIKNTLRTLANYFVTKHASYSVTEQYSKISKTLI